MVGEDLDARPDDEDHQEHVEEVLHPDPGGKPRVRVRLRRHHGPWISGDKVRDGRDLAQRLGNGHRAYEDHEAERKEPKEIEPPARTDTYTRRDSVRLGEPLQRIDDVLAYRELMPKARDAFG